MKIELPGTLRNNVKPRDWSSRRRLVSWAMIAIIVATSQSEAVAAGRLPSIFSDHELAGVPYETEEGI